MIPFSPTSPASPITTFGSKRRPRAQTVHATEGEPSESEHRCTFLDGTGGPIWNQKLLRPDGFPRSLVPHRPEINCENSRNTPADRANFSSRFMPANPLMLLPQVYTFFHHLRLLLSIPTTCYLPGNEGTRPLEISTQVPRMPRHQNGHQPMKHWHNFSLDWAWCNANHIGKHETK